MMEVLAREGLQPDLVVVVVGCSAGAMFGALIAAGHSADEAVRIATSLWFAPCAPGAKPLSVPTQTCATRH